MARILGKTGITVEGPAGWTYVEDLDSPQEGTVRFYAQKSETTKGYFSTSGLFAIVTWLMPQATDYAPEDILLGFVDGQVTEYASRFGGSPTVSKYTITSIGSTHVTGWTTTFTISGKGGTFSYGWADLRASGRFVEVICQSSPGSWDDVRGKCSDAAETIDLGS